MKAGTIVSIDGWHDEKSVEVNCEKALTNAALVDTMTEALV